MATVLVTGCSSGFGLLTSLELARRGHDVWASMRNPAKAGPLEEAAATEGVAVRVVPIDVDDEASVAAGVGLVLGEAGRLDVLVNNAGIEYRGPLEELSDAEVRQQFETNVFGVLRMVRAVAPTMRAQGSGVVVNVGSIAGLVSQPIGGLYAATKHAVEAITEALHYELGLFGIRVHVVEPGQFATALRDNWIPAAAFTPASPYWEVARRFEEKVTILVPGGERADPQVVATAIADVVEDPAAPLRTLVGADAELIAAARAQGTFEDFERLMRATLDFWDGYRGERP